MISCFLLTARFHARSTRDGVPSNISSDVELTATLRGTLSSWVSLVFLAEDVAGSFGGLTTGGDDEAFIVFEHLEPGLDVGRAVVQFRVVTTGFCT